jgi:hypothetical protein
MSSQRKRPVWPYICILVALLVLSLMAPERWEEASRRARRGNGTPVAQQASRGGFGPREGVWSENGPETCDWQSDQTAADHAPGVTDRDAISHEATSGDLSSTREIEAGADASEASATAVVAWPSGSGETKPAQSEPAKTEPQSAVASVSNESDEQDWAAETGSAETAESTATEPTDTVETAEAADDRPIAQTPEQAAEQAHEAIDESAAIQDVTPAAPAAPTEEQLDSPPSAPQSERRTESSANASNQAVVASDQPGAGGWTPPQDLLEQLQSLVSEPETSAWATTTLTVVEDFTASGGPGTSRGNSRLDRLRELAAQAEPLAMRIEERYVARRLRVAGYGLARRLAIWLPMAAIAEANANATVAVTDGGERTELLIACLDEVDKLAETAPAGANWRKYLQCDALTSLADRHTACGDREGQTLARDVLRRLEPERLTARQRKFTESEPVVALANELRHWAAEEVDINRVQANLEEYELTGRASVGKQVLADARLLRYSPEAPARYLAQAIESNYRVANLRMVISDDLLQRMMPKQDPRHQRIRQVVMGMEARGNTTTTSNLKIEFVPDEHRLRFVMQVTGMIHARAASEAGIVTIHTRADSDYVVLKNFEFTLAGLQAEPAMADAHTRSRLRGVDSPLEPVPLLGSALEGYVRDRFRNSKRAAERELRRTIMTKVIEQVEKETDTQIVDANERLNENLLGPLRGLDLEPSVAALQTTKDRMTIRLRLAGDDQLAANTPRPRAPADSLASIQLHESALNNILSRLELDGREFSQAELNHWVAKKLNRKFDQVDDNLRDDVFLKFAPHDAVRARALEGRVELTLSLAELRAEGSRFRNFVVRVYYRPDEASTSGELARDGVVQLIGQGLGPKAQIALRGVFSKTFSKDRRFRLLPARFAKEDQLSDVGITQMVIQDGWLGMGIGPVPRQAVKPIALRR